MVTSSADSTGRPVILWEACERIHVRRLLDDPSLVHTLLLSDSPKPLIVTGILDELPPSKATELGFGWDYWRAFEQPVRYFKTIVGPDWASPCPFRFVTPGFAGVQPVCETVQRILGGEALRIAHDKAQSSGSAVGSVRTFLAAIPGFAPLAHVVTRGESTVTLPGTSRHRS